MRRTCTAMVVMVLLLVSYILPPQSALAAPAPPLTSLQIYAVASANHPSWEYIGTSQYATTYDHGGAWMYVVTKEMGYGTNAIARYNGKNATLVQTQYILNGNIVVGYYYYWEVLNPAASGQFTYQSTSINYPWNTLSAFINIQ